jgi:hypothetical protein
VARIAHEFHLSFEVTVAPRMCSRIKGLAMENVSSALFSASLGCSVCRLWADADPFPLVKVCNYVRTRAVTKSVPAGNMKAH